MILFLLLGFFALFAASGTSWKVFSYLKNKKMKFLDNESKQNALDKTLQYNSKIDDNVNESAPPPRTFRVLAIATN